MDLADFCHFKRDTKLIERGSLFMTAWAITYPDVDMEQCFKEAHLWLLRNEPRYRDMRRFLSNWLRTAQKDALERRKGDRRMQDRRQSDRDTVKRIVEYEKNFEYEMSPEEMAEIRKRNMG